MILIVLYFLTRQSAAHGASTSVVVVVDVAVVATVLTADFGLVGFLSRLSSATMHSYAQAVNPASTVL